MESQRLQKPEFRVPVLKEAGIVLNRGRKKDKPLLGQRAEVTMIQHGWDIFPNPYCHFVVQLLFNDPNMPVVINTFECFYNSIIDFIA